MTQSIPSGFSMDELKSMLDRAASEAYGISSDDDNDDDNYQEKIINLAEQAIDESLDRADGDPMVHKMIVLMLSRRFEMWHETAAAELIKMGETDKAASWLKDAGHCQIINRTMLSVCLGETDFTCNIDE